jgi:SPX domain protein involved in polyphosphate accumulation
MVVRRLTPRQRRLSPDGAPSQRETTATKAALADILDEEEAAARFVESQSRIERYEYKYLIPERTVPEIRAAALATCKLDKHAGESRSYTIRSLYFDTDRYHLYWANEREQRDRFKVRARTYPGKAAPVFLEVKRRVGDVILKTRAALPEDLWREALSSTPGAALARIEEAARIKKGGLGALRIAELVHTYHLAPRLLVEYDREAYESVLDNYARLTFDRRIVCQAKDTFDLNADPKRWRAVDHPAQTWTHEPMCVLELKFERSPPRWMVNLIKRVELVRLSFSKYCYSVDAQHLLPTTRVSQLAGGLG